MTGPAARAKRMVANGTKGLLARGAFISARTEWTKPTGREASVLMCLWNRPERIVKVLEQLDVQDYPGGVRLYLWNNRRSDHGHYVDAIRRYSATGSLTRVDLVRSPFNLGSIARFYWAARIGRARPGAFVIVLDDDQDVRRDFVRRALAVASPRTIHAWWAFHRTGPGYWDREHSGVDDRVDHAGPGGSVLDTGLFTDGEFFRAMPEEFWFLDDIWLSEFAHRRGFRLAKLDVEIDFVMHDTNQFHGQIDDKARFFDYLRRHGQ